MTVVRLGNTAPIAVLRDPDDATRTVRTSIDVADAVTELRIPDGMTLGDAFTAITAPTRGAWDNHSDDPPEWVSSDDDDLAGLLAKHYTGDGHTCAVREFGDDTPLGLGLPGDEPAAKPKRGRGKTGA